MNRLSRNLTTIYRTERLIARRRFAVVQQQTFLMAIAGIAVLSGLILMNVALYFVLRNWVSPAGSAALLSIGNLALAGVLVMIAKRTSVEEEIAPAVEVRDMAIADIEEELDEMTREAREIVHAVKTIGANPLSSLPALLVPILTAILRDRTGKKQTSPSPPDK
ncbi:MAG: phage holin family protein [Pseudomonadota bacterium]